MASPTKRPLKAVWFVQAMTMLGVANNIGTGAGWAGWRLELDLGARELTVHQPKPPKGSTKVGLGPVKVPLSAVLAYQYAATGTKQSVDE